MNKMSAEALTGTAAEAPELEQAPARSLKRFIRPIVMFIVPLLLLIGGGVYWLTSGGSVSTDDAQVKQDIVSVPANGATAHPGSRDRRGHRWRTGQPRDQAQRAGSPAGAVDEGLHHACRL